MELLFYWIKEDKTFKDELFKFSNRYNVSVEHMEDSIEVKIDKNDDYILDFYGDHINSLTAIVGENGSGKTNLLYDLISCFTGYQYRFGKSYVIGLSTKDDQIILFHTVYKNDKNLTITTKLKYKINHIVGEEPFDNSPIFTPPKIDDLGIIYFNPIYDFRDYPYENETRYFADVSSTFLLWEDGKGISDEIDKARIHKSEEIKRQYRITKSPYLDLPYFDEISLPDQLEIQLILPHIKIRSLEATDRIMREKIQTVFSPFLDRKINSGDILHQDLAKIDLIYFFIEHLLKALADKKLFTHFFNVKEQEKELQKLEKKKSLENYLDFFYQFVKKVKYVKDDFIFEQIGFIFQIIDSMPELDKENMSSYIFDYDKADDFINPIEQIIAHIHNNFYVNALSVQWRNISSGELAYLNLFSRIMHGYSSLNQKATDERKTPYNSILIILDEGEHSMHPHWQKKYINILRKYLKIFKGVTFQVLITSHSPIMLSDIPKSDVIFLKKEKVGVTTVKNSKYREQTFGANIYSLYKDTFFMKDGFVGEFAMSKINDLFKRIEELENPSNEIIIELKKEIDLIGEPILRNTLLNKLRESLPVQDQIEELSREIERLKNRANGKD